MTYVVKAVAKDGKDVGYWSGDYEMMPRALPTEIAAMHGCFIASLLLKFEQNPKHATKLFKDQAERASDALAGQIAIMRARSSNRDLYKIAFHVTPLRQAEDDYAVLVMEEKITGGLSYGFF